MMEAKVVIQGMQKSAELASFLSEVKRVDFIDLAELIRLDKVIEEYGGKCPINVLADAPVKVADGLYFYLPTLGSGEVVRRLDPFFDNEDPCMEWLLAFCVAFSRDPEALATLTDEFTARDIVTEWANTLPITLTELRSAYSAAYDGYPDVYISDKVKGHYSALCTATNLSEQYGQSIEYWLWDTSAQRAIWIIREMGDAAAAANTVKPGKTQAIGAFNSLCKHIREKNDPADEPEDLPDAE